MDLQEGSQFVHELEDVSKVDEWQVHDGSEDHEENRVKILNLGEINTWCKLPRWGKEG